MDNASIIVQVSPRVSMPLYRIQGLTHIRDKSLGILAQFDGDMSLSLVASLTAKKEIQDTDKAIRIVSAKEKFRDMSIRN